MLKASTHSRSSWTILDLIRWTTGYFNRHGIEGARNDAEILLAHTLRMRRLDLYLNHDQPLCEEELRRFKVSIKRRMDREPVAYITGTREFWSLELAVNPSVLIPRPETECLVEAVLPFLKQDIGLPRRVLELGAGSGAIIIALAHEHPEHRFVAMDRSITALATARENARRHKLDHRIDWFCGNWDQALAPERALFDLMVANPPYIRGGDMEHLQPEIRDHEPRLALDGGGDGLACIRSIIRAATHYLKPAGRLVLEIGFDQGEAVTAIAGQRGQFQQATIMKDYSGHDRIVMMVRSQKNLATES